MGFFKYYNFFVDNFVAAFSLFGQSFEVDRLNVILPVGISFYTFQTMSYSIDVYRRKLEPTRDIVSFFAYVSFFPQLVAGPIERATNLLPQFYVHRKFEYHKAVDGMRQILWGFFKKIVIADNCARFANDIFNNSADYNGYTLFIGVLFFTFQIYGDFSGYSDIAIGTARLFGFSLMQNFAFPYFSRDIAEFWRRWHISLSTWFRDYVYIPLGGSKGSFWQNIRNTLIIFVVSVFWHGANWTFIVWGALNAFYFIPLLITNRNRKYIEIVAYNSFLPNFKELLQIATTFFLTLIAWIFFRSQNLHHAFEFIQKMFTGVFANPTEILTFKFWDQYKIIVLLLSFFISIEWLGRRNKYAIEKLDFLNNRFLRWSFYSLILLIIGLFMVTEETPFIYFQF